MVSNFAFSVSLLISIAKTIQGNPQEGWGSNAEIFEGNRV